MADGLVQVTAAVIVRDGCVLVCQRPAGGHHPLKWEFPGGKLEPGESLAACMQRELQEELGIEATVGKVLWRTDHQYPDRAPFSLTFFAISAYSGTLTNRIFAATRWVAVEDLGGVDFLEGDREFVATLAAGQVALPPDTIPRRRSLRLRGYDYSGAGVYVVTLCVHDRQCVFGTVSDGSVRLSPLGQIVADEWLRSTQIRHEIALDEWVVMPNHLHGIVVINQSGNAPIHPPLPRAPRSLSSFVAGFKASTTKRINQRRATPGRPVWQRNYYEHVVRNEASLDGIRRYILDNPARWADDEENPDRRARKQ